MLPYTSECQSFFLRRSSFFTQEGPHLKIQLLFRDTNLMKNTNQRGGELIYTTIVKFLQECVKENKVSSYSKILLRYRF